MELKKRQTSFDLNNFHFLMPGGFLRMLFQKYRFLSSKVPERVKQFKDIDDIISTFNFNIKDYKNNLSVIYNTEQIELSHFKIYPIYVEMRKRGWSDKELKK